MTSYVVLASDGEPYSFNGQVLVHDNKAELEWLIPGRKVIPLPDSFSSHPQMRWRDHPDMALISFPLDRREFR